MSALPSLPDAPSAHGPTSAPAESPLALSSEPAGTPERLSGPRRALVLFVVQGLPLLGFCAGVWLFLREGLSGLDLGLLVGMYLLTMIGIEVGFHRYFAHRTFETTRPLRALFLILGSMAGQGSALLWSAVHRVHHANTDQPGDPHSPLLGRRGAWDGLCGFFWAQFLWYLDVPAIGRFGRLVERHRASPADLLASTEDDQAHRFARTLPDLLRDEPLVRLNQRYGTWVLLGFALPTLVGGLVTGSWAGALRGLVWGGLVRYYVVQQVTFAINSVGHTVGSRSLNSRDDSRNNVVMALLTLGAGWHNNHHAFPGSARVDFRWWQVDLGGLLLRLLARLGLAWDLRVPSPEALAARSDR
ncbi:acyl-CoA desaturase [Archangium lansingense]|uniref:Fatty acid desaturase n=1 Tax=Archangium lansingense TaxID=2995310 RepID=A0ABT4A396_9BACT|nr:fatty acid desaturase [Archangium lansinium]MCY1076127.1 fatty acid desaturase [Archangium lansinium]